MNNTLTVTDTATETETDKDTAMDTETDTDTDINTDRQTDRLTGRQVDLVIHEWACGTKREWADMFCYICVQVCVCL